MPFNLVFFKTDHLGTPRVITDQDGKVLSRHDYLAYGEELTDPEFQTNRMKFTGHERDEESNLDYMKARYYTSGSGRFLQVDPGKDYDQRGPMSYNLYGYVRGNPIMGTDPTGMASDDPRGLENHLFPQKIDKAKEERKRKLRTHYESVSGNRQERLAESQSRTQQQQQSQQEEVHSVIPNGGIFIATGGGFSSGSGEDYASHGGNRQSGLYIGTHEGELQFGLFVVQDTVKTAKGARVGLNVEGGYYNGDANTFFSGTLNYGSGNLAFLNVDATYAKLTDTISGDIRGKSVAVGLSGAPISFALEKGVTRSWNWNLGN